MTDRVVGVWAHAAGDDDTLTAAMLEDCVDLVAEMQAVRGALLAAADRYEAATAAAWPDMPVREVRAGPTAADLLDELARLGATEAAVLPADVPDLPALLLGKLFSALTSAEVAVCPAAGGGLVAVAARLPLPAWVRDVMPTFDAADVLERLRSAAPPRALHVGPGWHRVRASADVAGLDPGLEGWEATRAWRVGRR